MFEIIKKIVDDWDPIGLLAAHCPPDEYDLETIEIVNYLTLNIQINDLSTKIYEIFVEFFGIDVFDKTEEECKVVADKIIKMLKK